MNESKQEEFGNTKDLAARNYFRNEGPFVDLFNVFLYQGEQVLDPKSLISLDNTELMVKEKLFIEKRRDIIKLLSMKTDGKQTYVILGLECQSKSDWRMAIRMMIYDALRYDAQLKRKLKRRELNPIISLVINLSKKKWSGPQSIKEIFKDLDPRLLKYISDYKMNLIDPHTMTDEELLLFKSDLRTLMVLLKYGEKKTELRKIIQEDKWMRKACREAAIFSNVYFGARLNVTEEEEEKTNMKHALALIIEEEGRKARIKGREEGKKEGRIAGIKAGKKEGRKEGRREGRKEGIQKGRVEGKKDAELQTAKRMMESGIDEDLILKCCQLTVKEIEMIRQEMILP